MGKKSGENGRSNSFHNNPAESAIVLRNKKSKHRRKPGPKLAPLDGHDAGGALGKASRKIAGKKDLVQVVRRMNPAASTGSLLLGGNNNSIDTMVKSSSTLNLGTDVTSQLRTMEAEVNMNA
ncbi:unnamed protein product, partial [Heterosigma akashiwo]